MTAEAAGVVPAPRSRSRLAPEPVATVAVLVALVAGCGGSSDSGAEGSSGAPTVSPSTTERAGTVVTASGGRVNYACTGKGGPPILLEAGSDSAGTQQYSPALVDPLAERTTVCTYDRPGTGLSHEVPDRRRTLDDVCDVQVEVIDALGLRAPYVLVGQSAGGNMVIGCADRHADRLAGLVVIEGYHDDPGEMREWQREEGWTWRDNPEHLDYLDIVDELDAVDRRLGDFPVLVLTASDADPGGVENQRHWLSLSSDSRQVVVAGGHDLHDENPETVAAETLRLLED